MSNYLHILPVGALRPSDDKHNLSLLVTRSSARSKSNHRVFSDVCVLHKWTGIGQSVHRRSGDRIPVCVKCFAAVQTGPGAQPPLQWVPGLFPSGLGRGVKHPTQLAPRLQKGYSYVSTVPMGLHRLF